MLRGKLVMINVCLTVVLILTMVLVGCTQPAPAPAPSPKTAPVAPPPTTAAPKPSPAPAPSPSPVAKPAFKMPDPIVCATLDVGQGGYLMAAAISDAMKKERGVTMRVLPTGTDTSRMSVLRMHRVTFAAVGMGLYMAQEGVYDFGTKDWGPQPIRVAVTNWARAGMIYMTAKDANIKTWADSKGKRFAWIPGYAAANIIGTAMLAFVNLTWKDVVRVDLPSFGAAGKAVVDGKVDAACCATYSAFNYELAASPRGIHYPPLPHNDEAGWARLLAVAPYYAKMMCTDGAQLDAAHPYEGGTYPNSNVIFYSDTDTELVYNVTKLYQELYPVYSKSNAPGITGYELKEIKPYFSWAVPFHEGAIRYYKEAGAWTAENDKNNQKMLERQRILQEAWDQAIIQSTEQKVKDADFSKFWMTARQKALEKAGLPVVYYPE